jgi:uncharacterized protein (TIGR02145 family)
MKTIRFTAFSILFGLLVLVSACKKETTPAAAPQTGSKIMITGQDAEAGLKTTTDGLTVNWAASDKIGLYCAQAGNGLNAEYTADGTGAKSSFTGSMTWGTSTHNFYAYYPWKSGSELVTAVPISLPDVQTQTDNTSDRIGALDFTVASATASPGVAGQLVDVNLNFNHVFTLLEFDLQLAAGQSSTSLSSIELYSADANISLTSGTIDLTQALPTGDNSYKIVNPVGTNKVTLNVSGCTLTSGSVTNAYMMILPGDQVLSTSNDMTIKITSVAGVTVVVKTGINFVRGKRYKIDLSNLTFSAPVSDVDANPYSTVTIGAQVWMASNLKTTKYNEGTAIPEAQNPTVTVIPTTGAYYWYNNDMTTYKDTYGALYNWYSVDNNLATKNASNGGKNICPSGWHVPTYTEWNILTTYLGGISVAGGKLKEVGTVHWTGPNTGATNESGFTALPGGFSNFNFSGSSHPLYSSYNGERGYWWSSSTYSTYFESILKIQYSSSTGDSGYTDPPDQFLSVRCVKD